jgi:hypothetical protein
LFNAFGISADAKQPLMEGAINLYRVGITPEMECLRVKGNMLLFALQAQEQKHKHTGGQNCLG